MMSAILVGRRGPHVRPNLLNTVSTVSDSSIAGITANMRNRNKTRLTITLADNYLYEYCTTITTQKQQQHFHFVS